MGELTTRDIGAIGNLASAATVAASSLEMKVADPKPYLHAIDRDKLREILGQKSKESGKGPIYVEPSGETDSTSIPDENAVVEDAADVESAKEESTSQDIKRGKIQVLGDFIDTDAVRVLIPLSLVQRKLRNPTARARRNPHNLQNQR